MVQTDSQPLYSGNEMLLKAEAYLANYNAWIVDAFVSHIERPLQPDANVLDFGAGIGTLSHLFEKKTLIRPVGVEIDDAQRRIYASRGFTAFTTIAEVQSKFDLIFTSNVLEHIEDDVAALELLREKLSPDAQLMIYVPAFEAIWTTMDDRVGHYRRYTKRNLKDKLRKAGFDIQRAQYCDSLGFFLTMLFKVVGSKEGNPTARSLRIYDRYLLPLSKMMDWFFFRFCGKNLFVVAKRQLNMPSSSKPA
jgi:SAM-dependent methyltransferase